MTNGWADKVVDPDRCVQHSAGRAEPLSTLKIPENLTWQKLQETFTGSNSKEVFSFTNANIISYFVVRTAVDGMPSSDVKSINNSALNLFRCGHVQDMMISYDKHSKVFTRNEERQNL